MIGHNHEHSMYSALDGFSTPEEIATRIEDIECSSCALTDHGVVTGHLPFDKAMRAKGLKPIFGCELYHGLKTDGFKGRERDQAHLIALAMTDEGLKNLWRLVNATSDEIHFHNVGRVFWDDIEKFHAGIVFTSACALGLVPRSILKGDYEPLNRYLDIIGDDFYIELSTYPIDKQFADRDSDDFLDMRIINEALVSVATERGIPMTYGDDGHFAFPDQYAKHDLYLALQTGQSIYTPADERTIWHPPDALVIKDEPMVREALSYLPQSVVDECLANSVALSERADAKLPAIKRHLPMFVPDDCPWLESDSKAFSAEELFIDLVESGIIERYGESASHEVWERVLYEVETCINDGIHHYFLMGWDEVQAAKRMGIEMGPGRGSSGGAIVAYALGITDVDPLHYGLIFERFWNSGRAKGFPDIDSDFSRKRRDEIIAYLKERWGTTRVNAIGTTGYLKPKKLIDTLAGGMGISFTEKNELKTIVGKTTKIEILGVEQIGWTPEFEPGKRHYVKQDVGDEIEQWITSDRSREKTRRRFVEMCEQCCSRVGQYGIHASGIVICDEELAALAPAYRRGGKNKGKPVTMFAMDEIDELMLIKLDVLGLRTLDALEYWRAAMAEQGIDIKWTGLDKEEHPPEMWQMLADKFTAGIFQVEDGYGRQLCKAMKPSTVEELAVLVALNRPGPIQAHIPDEYAARKSGQKPIDYIHPRMEELMAPILDVTYGLFVYQEQIISYFNAIGYTLSESDAVRKMLGKKLPEKLDALRNGTEEWDGRGYFALAETAGLPHDIAETVWNELEGFADYCYNKSHAVEYAVISMRCLFAKFYAPAEFYAATIRSLEPDRDKDKIDALIPEYVSECRRLNIPVHPPSILDSRSYAHVTADGELFFGFEDIANVGHSGPFIAYLRDEVGLDFSTPTAFQASFAAYNDTWNKEMKARVKAGEIITPKPKSPKQRLQANKITALIEVGAWDPLVPSEISMTEKQAIEQKLLHAILTDNSAEVLDRNAEEISQCDAYDDLLLPWDVVLKQYDFPEDTEYLDFTVCGIVVGVQEKTAKKSGKTFGVMTIEHGPHTVEFTVWNNKWRSHKFLFKLRNVGVFTLRHTPPNEYGEGYNFIRGHLLT